MPIPSLRDLLRPATARFVKYENVSVPIGVSNTYRDPVTLNPLGVAFTWFKVKYSIGGSVAVLETITVRVETVLDEGSTLYVEKSVPATGSEWLSDNDLLSLVKHGSDVVAVRVYAKTNLPSTNASVTVTLVGYG
jgi:hypothetical protein